MFSVDATKNGVDNMVSCCRANPEHSLRVFFAGTLWLDIARFPVANDRGRNLFGQFSSWRRPRGMRGTCLKSPCRN